MPVIELKLNEMLKLGRNQTWDALVKKYGQKQAIQPAGRPLPPADDVEVTQAEVDAAVEVWDGNDDLPSGLLEAKTASAEELEEAE